MSSTGRKINWRILGAEATAIVASILLALAVDAWWTTRSDLQRLDAGLANLRTELQANVAMIDRYEKLHKHIVDTGVAMLAADPAEATVEQCGVVFLQGWVTDYSMGALEIVLGSTRLDLIEDQQLTADLVALQAFYEDAVEDERWAIDQLMGKWIPYISTVVPVGTMWDVALPGVSFPVTGDASNADVTSAAATLEFRNHVTNRIGFETLSIEAQKNLRAKLRSVIERIDATLD